MSCRRAARRVAPQRFVAVSIPGDDERGTPEHWNVIDREQRERDRPLAGMSEAFRLERELNEAK